MYIYIMFLFVKESDIFFTCSQNTIHPQECLGSLQLATKCIMPLLHVHRCLINVKKIRDQIKSVP